MLPFFASGMLPGEDESPTPPRQNSRSSFIGQIDAPEQNPLWHQPFETTGKYKISDGDLTNDLKMLFPQHNQHIHHVKVKLMTFLEEVPILHFPAYAGIRGHAFMSAQTTIEVTKKRVVGHPVAQTYQEPAAVPEHSIRF
jgi:hypothetical protein